VRQKETSVIQTEGLALGDQLGTVNFEDISERSANYGSSSVVA
jgi:hypothetical protein